MTRVGNFSSSNLYRLMGSGVRKMTEAELKARPKSGTGSRTTQVEDPNILDSTALTYIKEKVRETRLQRPISLDHSANPTMWGTSVEYLAHRTLGDIFSDLVSNVRYKHPTIDYWVGMPDILSEKTNTVADIKSPWSLTEFCNYVEWCDGENGLQNLKENKKENYWQLISNAILTGSKYIELIVFCPYKSQLEEIRASWDGDGDYYRLAMKDDKELPYINEGGYYRNLYRWTWEAPKEDLEHCSMRMKLASEELKNRL